MALTKEQILNAKDARVEAIDVPEWGGSCHLKVMSGVERDAFEERVFGEDGSVKAARRKFTCTLLAQTICDENGELLFTVDDLNELVKKSANVLDRVAKAALKLNGLSPDSQEELEKN